MNKKGGKIRIIPRIDVKGPNLVKGIHLEGLRVLGKPEDFAFKYYTDGADELLYMDIVASLYGRNNLLKIVEKTAQNIFIPLTAGGGVRTFRDIQALLRAGADKVAINTAVIKNPKLITEAANSFGSQCVVVSIEAKKQNDGTYEAYTDNGRERTGLNVLEWAERADKLGAGEILITSIDKEGTGEGYDIELIKKIVKSVSVPVIACGGAGKKEDVLRVIKESDIKAVSAASIFHYNYLDAKTNPFKYEDEGNIDFLRMDDLKDSGRVKPTGIVELKFFLEKSEITCRKSFKNKEKKQVVAEKYRPLVAIIDCGLGNLFSAKNALEFSGARSVITDDPKKIEMADGLILPGVGAFGDGMKGLTERGLIEPIKLAVAKGKPLFGICLGMQLLMSESEEFGKHNGLNLIKGKVVRLKESSPLKIPHIGWNEIYQPNKNIIWKKNILDGMKGGENFYFVHSYMVLPKNYSNTIAITKYGDNVFCSVISKDNIHGCQFHPERSGESGLKFYKNIINLIKYEKIGNTQRGKKA